MSDDHRKPPMDAAESETLRMCGNSMHGNRETLETLALQGAGRSGKALRRTPGMYVPRESDGLRCAVSFFRARSRRFGCVIEL